MIEKVKVGKADKRRINRYVFLAMWIAGQVAGWHLTVVINNWDSDLISALLIGLSIGIPTVLVQMLSLYLYFGRWFRWWIPLNLAAWALGAVAITYVGNLGIDGSSDFRFIVEILSLFLIPSLAQAWLLRKLLRQAWLWLLSAIVGSIVFAGVMQQFGPSNQIAYPAFAAYAAVTGLTLLWLYGTQTNEGKLKHYSAVSRLEDGGEDATNSVELEETVQRKVI